MTRRSQRAEKTSAPRRARALQKVCCAIIITLCAHLGAMPTAALGALSPEPNDPRWPSQWNLSEGVGAGIAVLPAWEVADGRGVVVGIVDSGIVAHPEFRGRVLPGYDFISDAWSANDGDGRDADPRDPGNWVTAEEAASLEEDGNDCKAENSDWHGTHVAGIVAAAINNRIGGAGVAPKALLLPIRVIGKCGGTERDLIDGIRWAVGLEVDGVAPNQNPADVINLSLGGEGDCSPRLQEAINDAVAANAFVVASAGNESYDASRVTPANCDGVIVVSALAQDGGLAEYSNFGDAVDVAAPGGGSVSTILGPIDRGSTKPTGPGYAGYRGTSMAAPHVSGVLALLRQIDPTLSVSDSLDLLYGNLSPFAAIQTRSCVEGVCGRGQLNAARLVLALLGRATPVVEHTFPSEITLGSVGEYEFSLDGEPTDIGSSSTPTVCSYEDGILTTYSRGICVIGYESVGTSARKPVSSALTVTVIGIPATLAVTAPAEGMAGSRSTISAAVDSGGVVVFKSLTPRRCTVRNSGSVRYLRTGKCSVKVRARATETYDPATTVVQIAIR